MDAALSHDAPFTSNERALDILRELIPGGVDGNAKYFAHMPVARHAQGCRLTDVEGNEYIDYCCGYGPLIFGHNDPDIVGALTASIASSGMLYGLPHLGIRDAVLLIRQCLDYVRTVRFTSSGTEATLTCIRLARGITRRDKIVKFYGTYHGTHEAVLVGTKITADRPEFPHVDPDSAGIPMGVQRDTYVLPFNDADYARRFLTAHGGEIAAVLVEPLLGSYGVVATVEFLRTLREITRKQGILLVFDEIVTAFRLALGGAGELFGVTPDLVALGKGLGAGFPLGAVAGPREIMNAVAPAANSYLGSREVVYHSGTYNANPMTTAAVSATLRKLIEGDALRRMRFNGDRIRGALFDLMRTHGVAGTVLGDGPFLQWYFGVEGDITRPEELLKADRSVAQRFHSLLLKQGVFFMPGLRGYVSAAHGEADIEATITAMEAVFKQL